MARSVGVIVHLPLLSTRAEPTTVVPSSSVIRSPALPEPDTTGCVSSVVELATIGPVTGPSLSWTLLIVGGCGLVVSTLISIGLDGSLVLPAAFVSEAVIS